MTNKSYSKEKKLPPIVPKKDPALKNLASQPSTSKIIPVKVDIPIFNLRAREEPLDNNFTKNVKQSQQAELDKLVGSIGLDSEFEVKKRNSNEPKAITLESIMRPKARLDIKSHHIRQVETPLEMEFLSKVKPKPPALKPKPKDKSQIKFNQAVSPKTKPKLKPKTIEYEIEKPVTESIIVNQTSTRSEKLNFSIYNKHTSNVNNESKNLSNLESNFIPTPRAQTLPMFALPNLARGSAPVRLPMMTTSEVIPANIRSITNITVKSKTLDNSELDNEGQKLNHLTKNRARGPKRRLPKNISNSRLSSGSSKIDYNDDSSSLRSFGYDKSVFSGSSASSQSSSWSYENERMKPIVKKKAPPPIKKPSKRVICV